MRIIFQLLFSIALVSPVTAKELNDVNMSNSIKIGAKELQLNGMGLRTVVKFGFTIKVYVAGLYMEKKSSDSDAIVKNDEVKHLRMHFVRPVDRDALIEAFGTGYESSCFVECQEQKKQFAQLAINIVSMRKDNEIQLTFYKDKVIIDSSGPNAKTATIENPALSRNLLSLFIDKNKNPGKDFRKGLLSL